MKRMMKPMHRLPPPPGLLCCLVVVASLLAATGVLAASAAALSQERASGAQNIAAGDEAGGAPEALAPLAPRARRSPLPVAQVGALKVYQEPRLAARHELSELITQAHRDKQAERRLMKLLINFKLASDLDDFAYPISAGRLLFSEPPAASRRALEEPAEAAAELAQLEQLAAVAAAAEEEANGEQVAADELGQLASLQLGKRREYIKPCMFNAVSCAKNPFKKY